MEVKCIMKLIRSCIVSFSMYSKIPMPQFKWNDDDMKYMLVFFPWIGAVIGLLLMLWKYIYSHFGVADICYVCIGALIPMAVTGGFHIDGFMDTMDAFHSYKPREEKLAILKDSHIGAFAVIMLAAYGLLFMGAFSQIMNDKAFIVFCAGFFISRCLSGIAVVSFNRQKSDGCIYVCRHCTQNDREGCTIHPACIVYGCFTHCVTALCCGYDHCGSILLLVLLCENQKGAWRHHR